MAEYKIENDKKYTMLELTKRLVPDCYYALGLHGLNELLSDFMIALNVSYIKFQKANMKYVENETEYQKMKTYVIFKMKQDGEKMTIITNTYKGHEELNNLYSKRERWKREAEILEQVIQIYKKHIARIEADIRQERMV